MKAFEPTGEQGKVIDHRGSHMLVFAGPGTGKTETLARRFASVVHDDGVAAGAILVLTFSRRAADAMRERIVVRMRERAGAGIAVPELHVYTFHGFCSRLLEAGRPRGARRNLLTPVKERLLWKEIIANLTLPAFAPDVIESNAFATAVLNLIARLKGDGVTPDAFARDAHGDARLSGLAELYRRMDEQRTRLGLSDFRDLVADAVRELGDQSSGACAWMRAHGEFEHVLVDEFQDSDPMQLRLLEALGGDALFGKPPKPEMCFVGDFNQSIYRFRGADPQNIIRVKDRFACREFGLRLNRRSVQAVLDVANRTPRMRPESLTVAEPGNKTVGSFKLLRTETADDEVAAVANAVAQRVRAGTPPRNVAVLLRVVEPYRGAIARELQARGIPVAAQSTAGFREDTLIDAVLSCVRILAGEGDASTWRRLLKNPVIGFRPLTVSLALNGDPHFAEKPRAALDAHSPKGRWAWSDFASRLDACRSAGGPPFRFDPAALVQAVARDLDLLWPLREEADVPGFDPLASPARLETLLQAAHDIRDTAAQLGGPRLDAKAFLAALDDVMVLLGDPFEGPQSGIEGVPVMSIHGAKGLEFDLVVVPQLIDGVLPTRARSDPLFGARPSRYVRSTDDAALEEASLWYVAATRARYDVLATAARLGDDAAEQPLSPFAQLIGDEASVIAPPSRIAPLGVAAAYAAASGAEQHSAPVRRFVEERPVLGAFLRDGDLIDAAARPLTWQVDRLSASGVEAYVACPRRWFYQHALHLPDEDDDVTRMGRFVHGVLERFHQDATDFSDASSAELDVDRIVAALTPIAHEEARRVASSGDLSTGSLLYRYELARIMRQLRAYAEWLIDEVRIRPFVVVACEQRLEVPLGSVRLVGKVDRIDRLADGTLAVRDYKSGRLHNKSADTVDEVLARIDSDAPGINLFGNAPEGLKLQTLLYVRGVEKMFGAPVSRADYIYLAGATKGDTDVYVDSIALGGRGLTRENLDAVYDVIAAGVAREVSTGTINAFSTAQDEKTCQWCHFAQICPGPGSIRYANNNDNEIDNP